MGVARDGEADPTVDLNHLLAAQQSVLTTQEFGRGGLKLGVITPRGHRDRGEIHQGSRRVGAQRHVGALVLDRLESPNGLTKLLTDLGVFRRQIPRALAEPGEHRRRQQAQKNVAAECGRSAHGTACARQNRLVKRDAVNGR